MDLSSWDRVLICRHPKRPHADDYIAAMTTDFMELHGDRTFGDDPSVIGGLCKIADIPCMIIGQNKGSTTEERIRCNFGMVSPEGFRKAMRLMRLAARIHLPIVSLLDTPGAYAGLEAEQRGQGWVIAENLQAMFSIPSPIIALVIGEGCSGGALGMGVGDTVLMLEHSYYTVISPEGCASILWKDTSKKQEAASALQLHAEDLLSLSIIDEIIPEPPGGAHNDPALMFDRVKECLVGHIKALQSIPTDRLLENRYQKFRRIGAYDAT